MNPGLSTCLSIGLVSTLAVFTNAAADTGVSCAEDPACINRLHPDIPAVANTDPGERIVFVGSD